MSDQADKVQEATGWKPPVRTDFGTGEAALVMQDDWDDAVKRIVALNNFRSRVEEALGRLGMVLPPFGAPSDERAKAGKADA